MRMKIFPMRSCVMYLGVANDGTWILGDMKCEGTRQARYQ